jgi:hypothetical protein
VAKRGRVVVWGGGGTVGGGWLSAGMFGSAHAIDFVNICPCLCLQKSFHPTLVWLTSELSDCCHQPSLRSVDRYGVSL